ncbi:RING finger protein 11-like [Phacochoerus africanus]|uniref:RING finger protein 11-like n=1 Tax=Phacochoerus africanus TaxID=41426 RepID=UPI001FD881C2|nr:RING finger protein 11-like [Phacochoerus africanus]XP_047610333.1 RING finger protein 11-like [Phacochoerus africanus]XP_047610335.1 RING finger protein 11-like [Phacochoerus africanus]XP_047610336.1 RING finger protein 11-like [Phacochoerus africanus]XP_047610337.1 RING finger protein 11-like [Phacochoerus africanus]XP_047610338.1 RING finger protein 11-like [Phacochoerus africanus]
MGNCLIPHTSEDLLVPESATRFGGRRRRARSRERRPRDQVPGWAPAAPLVQEEQVRVPQRISQIQCLPKGVYERDGSQEKMEQEECAICTLDFVCGDPIRSLPCKHFYHLGCIDGWLTRSFTCPYCRGPADGPQPSSRDTP